MIVLDQPIGLTYGWLGSRTYDNRWDDATTYWHNIGYPQDWSGSGEIAEWQTDFSLNELDSASGATRLIRSNTFDNWPGQSGGPIFGFWSDGPTPSAWCRDRHQTSTTSRAAACCRRWCDKPGTNIHK